MHPLGRTLAYFAVALSIGLGIGHATAEPLTERQAQDAAARIDQLLAADLQAAKLQPLGQIDDGSFLRRAYLGIIGRIPTEEESRAFLDSKDTAKRQKLVDALVASPGFDSHLFNWTADLLRIQTNQQQFGLGWHVWLRKSLAQNKPWDTTVREMLSSTGHAANNPAVGYYLRDPNMQLDNFSNTMQVFLGRQIGCAQCHDHPFDDWTQHEYYQMAAFSGGLNYRSDDVRETVRRVARELTPPTTTTAEVPQTREGARARQQEQKRQAALVGKYGKTLQPLFKDFNKNGLFDDPARLLKLPEDYKYKDAKPRDIVAPETLFGEKLVNIPPHQRRETFANWVTARENPYFTKVIANRLWARTFGHGLLDPVDDWSKDSQPAHPQILAFLESSMKAVDYDLRQFSRILFLTQLFQRECDPTEPEPGVPHLVRGPALQRMTAEQIYDSMLVLTRGQVDDSPLSANQRKWQAYTVAIGKLLHGKAKDLVALSASTAAADKIYLDSRSEARRLRGLLTDTQDPEQRKKLTAQMVAAQKLSQENRKLSDPLVNVGGGEQMGMSMTMEDGGAKDGGRNPRGRDGAARNNARASELPAPFNPGTMIREFGGSDRGTPSSGNLIPTVPQALALLNDPATDIIGGKRSILQQRLSTVSTPEEQLDIIFLRLYSRHPSETEIQRFTPAPEDKTALRDLTRAMLTSNRFIFVP